MKPHWYQYVPHGASRQRATCSTRNSFSIRKRCVALPIPSGHRHKMLVYTKQNLVLFPWHNPQNVFWAWAKIPLNVVRCFVFKADRARDRRARDLWCFCPTCCVARSNCRNPPPHPTPKSTDTDTRTDGDCTSPLWGLKNAQHDSWTLPDFHEKYVADPSLVCCNMKLWAKVIF